MHFLSNLVSLSAGIDFDEFLDMYKRLFILHKSSVSQGVSSIVRRTQPNKSPRRKVALLSLCSNSVLSRSVLHDLLYSTLLHVSVSLTFQLSTLFSGF